MSFDLICHLHGEQPGRTICRFCSYGKVLPERQSKGRFCPVSIAQILDRYIPVTESGCWLWLGSVNGGGYPRVQKVSGEVSATRLFYEHHKGPIPEGRLICHTCDVPLCVNPAHLFAATGQENMQDMVRKGRVGRRVRKLTERERSAITESSEGTSVLAKRFKLSTRYVRQLRNDSSAVRKAGLPRTYHLGDGAISLPLDLANDQFQDLGDRFP